MKKRLENYFSDLMTEGYVGVKFKTVFLEKIIPINEKISELIYWCKKFDESGITPQSYGNLSFRTKDGFIISGAGTDLGSVKEKDFTEVTDCKIEERNVFSKGIIEPSSESFIHFEIYKMRPDINAIFHGHDTVVLEKLNKMNMLCTEEEKPYGTMELLEQVKNLIVKNKETNYFIWKNHGFCSLGNTMKQAGQRAIETHDKAEVIK